MFLARDRAPVQQTSDCERAERTSVLGALPEPLRSHAFVVREVDLTQIHRDRAADALAVGLEVADRFFLLTSTFALADRAWHELVDRAAEAFAQPSAHEPTRVDLHDHVTDYVWTLFGRFHARLLDDRGQVPAARVLDHSGCVELAVSALDPTRSRIEHPEPRKLVSQALSFRSPFILDVRHSFGLQADDNVIAKPFSCFFERDPDSHEFLRGDSQSVRKEE